MSTENTYTPKEIALELSITAKAFRAWLRTQTDDRAGRGGSWSFDEATKDELIRRYKERTTNKGKEVTPVLHEDAS